MASKKSVTAPGTRTTRRSFLGNVGVAGAALAGSLGAPSVFPANHSRVTSQAEPCEFSALPTDFVYLNTGTEGSMPSCVLTVLQDGMRQWAANPTSSYELDPALGKRQEQNRTQVARFLGVGMNNICLTDNTTMGLSMTLTGLNFRPDDFVITTNHEHNAVKSPLQILQERTGLRIKERAFPPTATLREMNAAELLNALFPNTRELQGAAALCVSHVYPTTGVRLPLRALRQKADELDIRYLIVDGAQALGMLDLSNAADELSNSDFYACPGHKWLNGPPSTGVLYIRDAEIRPPEFYPTISQRMGRYSDCGDGADTCFPMAEALQIRGCSNTPGFAAMIKAMKFAENAGGAAQVEKHILRLSRAVKEIILARAPDSIVSPHIDAALSSGLTTFFPFRWNDPGTCFKDKKTADWVVNELLEKNIQVRSIGFPDATANRSSAQHGDSPSYVIRVSTGYLNTSDQIETFKNALQEVLTRIR